MGHVVGYEAGSVNSFPNFDTAGPTGFGMLQDALKVNLYALCAEGAAVPGTSPGFTPILVELPRLKLVESGPGLPMTRLDIAVNLISSNLIHAK